MPPGTSTSARSRSSATAASYKFNSSGALLAFTPMVGEFRLAMDDVDGVLWAQETSGMLYGVNPATMKATPVVNLNTRWSATEPALDILKRQQVNLVMARPRYGDISIHSVDQGDLDILISGQATPGGDPFVARLRVRQQSQSTADLLVASIPLPDIITPPPLDAQPPGLAVAPDGTILTDLPKNVSGGISPFYLAGLNVDYPESGVGSPQFVQAADNSQVYSVGMAASSVPGGGFYVATVANGTGYGAGPAILHVDPSLGEVDRAIDLSSYGLGVTAPRDVAVGPGDSTLYVVMSSQILKVTTSNHAPVTLFNESFYLHHNPDVAAAVKAGYFASGYQHFLQFGVYEGRMGTPDWTPAIETAYLAANPDVNAAVKSGAIHSSYEHFFLFGQHENRSGAPLVS